jgi:UDP-N-acetylmuramate dehydrogenase
MTSLPLPLGQGVPLAPRTTLELGGDARFFLAATRESDIVEALHWAAAQGHPVALLGGGSNVVVADAGFPGLVLHLATRGIEVARRPGEVLLTVAAGEPWDEVVALAVAEGWAGIECLSGIPGTAGATPIQNVGAYGQEVSAVLRQVRALDRRTLTVVTLSPDQLSLGYRTSLLKRNPHRYVVLSVTLALTPGGAPTLAYPDLATALPSRRHGPELRHVRDAVLDIRRSKSMVIHPDDPNRRSAGSFFVNPLLSRQAASQVATRAAARGHLHRPEDLPHFPGPAGLVKIPAAWLVEQAGFRRGYRRGQVGLSTRHALALVHHGGGSAAQLLALAGDIVAAVHQRFGLTLATEPTWLDGSPLLPLPVPR